MFVDNCLPFSCFFWPLHCLLFIDWWIHGFFLPLWYYQTLKMNDKYFRRFMINVLTSIFLWWIFLSSESTFLCLFFFIFQLIYQSLFLQVSFINSRIQGKYSIRVTRNLYLSHLVKLYMVDTCVSGCICNELFAYIFSQIWCFFVFPLSFFAFSVCKN